MKENYLLYFKGVSSFMDYYSKLGTNNKWKIEEGLMNSRGEAIKNKRYALRLKELFSEKRLFRKQVSNAEIVTWLDTFVHLSRIICYLTKSNDDTCLNELEIFIEYVIPMSKMSRVDCVFRYLDRHCLLEFRTVSDFKKMKTAFDKKRLELLIYKDLMGNYIHYPAKITLLPFIGLYEYNYKELNEKHLDSNIKQAKFASEYITVFILKQNY